MVNVSRAYREWLIIDQKHLKAYTFLAENRGTLLGRPLYGDSTLFAG